MTMAGDDGLFAYVGGWDRHKAPPGNGFGVYSVDPTSGELTFLKAVAPQITVGAACIDHRRGVLYCVDEYDTLPGNFLGGGGQVYAFAIDRATGDLTEISRGPSYGSLPSHVAFDRNRRFLVVPHHTDRTPITKVVRESSGRFGIALAYDDATTVLFPIGADGSIGPPCDVHIHEGTGGPLPRQTHPQLHCVTPSPSGGLFAVTDKGNDQLQLFRIDHAARRLQRCGLFHATPGSSPRYVVFHPDRPYVFLNHETKGLVTALRYGEDGELEQIEVVSVLPDDRPDGPGVKQSDLKIHPSGRYLYTLIREMDAVTVFGIDEATGRLTRIQTVELDGGGPRGCAISPDGRFMYLACLASHEVRTWSIGEDGLLSSTGRSVPQRNAGCIAVFDPKRHTD